MTFESVLTRVLVLVCMSWLSLTSLSAQSLPDERRVTVDFVDIPLDSALLLLSYHSGVSIPFNPNDLPNDKLVTLSANRLMLGLALDNVLSNSNLKYSLVGNQIAIKKVDLDVESLAFVNVSGYIKDQDSGEHLPYAHISSRNGEHGVISNEFGYYSLTVPSGAYHMVCSYVGYKDMQIDVSMMRDTVINFGLEGAEYLSEVVIVSESQKEFRKSEQHDQMPIELLGSMASLAGESDIIRLAQMRPGVNAQVDGFGGLFVRGGSADQNLVLYDGVPVYNTGHALGLFSIFNSGAIKSADLTKGGFPARYGGRLSSIFDIRTKDGNNQRLAGEVGVSPLMIKGTIEGPIKKGKSSFFLSGRRTIIDPWLRPLSKYQFERNNEEGQINFFFYDLNAKINFDLGENNKFFISAYRGGDKYANEVKGVINRDFGSTEELDVTDIYWGNEVITARWASRLGKKLFFHSSVSSTSFNFDNFDFLRTTDMAEKVISKSYLSRLYSTNIQDLIAAANMDWYASPKYFIKVGGSYTNHSFRPGSDTEAILRNPELNALINEEDRVTIETIKAHNVFDDISGNETRLYIENDIRLGLRFSTNIGVHWSSIKTGLNRYVSLQPRISAQYRISDQFTLRAGYSEMDQYFHLLSSASLGLPSDVWLPSTDQLRPETSRQWSGSIEGRFAGWHASLGVFDKTFDYLTGYAQGAAPDISGSTNWQEAVPVGSGYAQGIELEVQRVAGRLRGWASYTLSKSMRTFPTINDGHAFRADNDRLHLLNIVGLFSLNDNMEIAANWTYGTSAPVTVASSTDPIVIDGEIRFVPTISQINSGQLPAYHKLDISFHSTNQYKWGTQKFSFGAYNVYAQRNPYYIEVVLDESEQEFNFEQISILPFIPYAGLTLTF